MQKYVSTSFKNSVNTDTCHNHIYVMEDNTVYIFDTNSDNYVYVLKNCAITEYFEINSLDYQIYERSYIDAELGRNGGTFHNTMDRLGFIYSKERKLPSKIYVGGRNVLRESRDRELDIGALYISRPFVSVDITGKEIWYMYSLLQTKELKLIWIPKVERNASLHINSGMGTNHVKIEKDFKSVEGVLFVIAPHDGYYSGSQISCYYGGYKRTYSDYMSALYAVNGVIESAYDSGVYIFPSAEELFRYRTLGIFDDDE